MRRLACTLLLALALLEGCAGTPPAAGGDASDPNGGPDAASAGDATAAADAASQEGDLDELIIDRMKRAHVPGLAAAVIRDGAVAWTRGYGFADLESETPVTPDTIFMLASVSKTVTATAFMQLWEKGIASLDVDVDDYLSFTVRNPAAPGAALTPRMLLTHTSSIQDNWDVLEALYVEGDSPIALGDFLRDYLTPEGEYYAADDNYYAYAPGTTWNYSNVAVALAGYLAEARGGSSFETLCQENIFAPLEMNETSWRLAPFEPSHLATPYSWIDGEYVASAHYGYPDFPDGGLRTSVAQLGRFLAAYSRGGELDGERVLESSTIDEMWQVQFPELDAAQGVAWYYEDRPIGRVVGHGGGDVGVATEMLLRVEDGVGVIVVMNGDWTDPALIQEIEHRLFEEAETL